MDANGAGRQPSLGTRPTGPQELGKKEDVTDWSSDDAEKIKASSGKKQFNMALCSVCEDGISPSPVQRLSNALYLVQKYVLQVCFKINQQCGANFTSANSRVI